MRYAFGAAFVIASLAVPGYAADDPSRTKPPSAQSSKEIAPSELKVAPVPPGPPEPRKKESAESPPVKGDEPKTTAAGETSKKRTKKPGSAGLANEARPGLGTRADDPDPWANPTEPPKEASSKSKPEATKHGYEEPRPEPREQAPDSLAHEQERSTGVSGHTGNT